MALAEFADLTVLRVGRRLGGPEALGLVPARVRPCGWVSAGDEIVGPEEGGVAVREKNELLGGFCQLRVADLPGGVHECWNFGFGVKDEARLAKGLDIATVGTIGEAREIQFYVVAGAAGRRVACIIDDGEDGLATESLVESAGGEGCSCSCKRERNLHSTKPFCVDKLAAVVDIKVPWSLNSFLKAGVFCFRAPSECSRFREIPRRTMKTFLW